MAPDLDTAEVETQLAKLKEAAIKEECWSCDCLQGFITQLELDAAEDVTHLSGPLKVPRDELHGCLGCEPCPPAALFAEYIRRHAAQGGRS